MSRFRVIRTTIRRNRHPRQRYDHHCSRDAFAGRPTTLRLDSVQYWCLFNDGQMRCAGPSFVAASELAIDGADRLGVLRVELDDDGTLLLAEAVRGRAFRPASSST